MKNYIKVLLALLLLTLYSCYGTDDDTALAYYCNGNCNTISGRVYTEDNVGVANVTLLFSCNQSGIGINHTRLIAKTKTDANGYYTLEGYVKDNELDSGDFTIVIDKQKLETSLSSNFFKPSDFNSQYPAVNECLLIGMLNDRSPITNLDYKIPYKTTQVINLNDFNPIAANDYFGVANRIKYGFSNGFFTFYTIKDGANFLYANSVNSTVTLNAAFGENEFYILKLKNNAIVEEPVQTHTIANPNPNVPLNFSY